MTLIFFIEIRIFLNFSKKKFCSSNPVKNSSNRRRIAYLLLSNFFRLYFLTKFEVTLIFQYMMPKIPFREILRDLDAENLRFVNVKRLKS